MMSQNKSDIQIVVNSMSQFTDNLAATNVIADCALELIFPDNDITATGSCL